MAGYLQHINKSKLQSYPRYLISVTLFLYSFTQIALGIAIAEVCAGKNLKTKQFYTVLF
jgi:hypothetical protein